MKSEAGHFIVETVELRAAFAASSARSLPRIPVQLDGWDENLNYFLQT